MEVKTTVPALAVVRFFKKFRLVVDIVLWFDLVKITILKKINPRGVEMRTKYHSSANSAQGFERFLLLI